MIPPGGNPDEAKEGIGQIIAVSFESALKVGLKPHDN